MTQNWRVWVVLYEKGISFSLLHPLDPVLSVRVEMRGRGRDCGAAFAYLRFRCQRAEKHCVKDRHFSMF